MFAEGGCLSGLAPGFLGWRKPAIQGAQVDDATAAELEEQVLKVLHPQLQAMQESLMSELQGVSTRLLKAKAPAQSKESPKWTDVKSDLCFSSGGAKEEPLSPVNRRGHSTSSIKDSKSPDDPHSLPLAKRTFKRRWTTATDGIEGALAKVHTREILWAEDIDTPASTVVSAATSDAPDVASDASNSPSRRPSLGENNSELAKVRRPSRITFQSVAGQEEESVEAEDPEPPTPAHCSEASSRACSDASSLLWRADALDFGENLAAEAAAKKGNTSVDSIVALVQTERDRWEEEKQALEARVEDLKEQLRAMQAKHQPDAEKEALKRLYQELRKAMKARSRFGAWVCERHMKESDDDEDTEKPGVSEKEDLRRRMSILGVQLREARAAIGIGASSESDISPVRRPPGPPIRRG